jgi:hypothetical protein
MNIRISTRQAVLLAALALGGVAMAAGPGPAPQGAPNVQDHHGMMAGGGMMGGGGGGMMDGMMDMMGSCQSMMGNRENMGMMGMPAFPPGNEKLEAQMHAEMMQKMGEIAARYADRIKEGR